MQQQNRLPQTKSVLPLERNTIRRTLQLIEKANQAFGLSIKPPDISFDLKGQAAGMVKFPTTGVIQIRFNRTLLEENQQHFFAQTLPHEVAHLVARTRYGSGIRPHGSEWQQVMLFFEAKPQRCHSYNISNLRTRKMKRFNYRCKCQKHQLTTIRHNRVLRGQTYLCRYCATPLTQNPDKYTP